MDQICLHWDFNDATLLVLEQMVAVEDSIHDLILAYKGKLNLERINLEYLKQPSLPGLLSVTCSLSPLLLFLRG